MPLIKRNNCVPGRKTCPIFPLENGRGRRDDTHKENVLLLHLSARKSSVVRGEVRLSLLYQHTQHCTFTRRPWDATVPPKEGTEQSAFRCSRMLAIWSRVEPAHFPHGWRWSWGDTTDEEIIKPSMSPQALGATAESSDGMSSFLCLQH